MCHDKHCICTLLACLVVALYHTAKVFSKCSFPNFCSCRIMHHFIFYSWIWFPQSQDVPWDLCSVWSGEQWRANGNTVCWMRLRGVNIALKVAFSLMVSTFIAWCITMRWVACEGKGPLVVGGFVGLCCVLNECCWLGGAIIFIDGCSGMSLPGIGWTLLVKGMPSGVLFWVNRWWIHGVIFRTLFLLLDSALAL